MGGDETALYRAGRYRMEFTAADILTLCASGLVLVGTVALAIADWPEEER